MITYYLVVSEKELEKIIRFEGSPASFAISQAEKLAKLKNEKYLVLNVMDTAEPPISQKAAEQCVHPTAAGGSTSDNDSESGGG